MTAETTLATTGSTIVLDRDQGEALWFNNDLLTLKATGAQTDGGLLLVEELARREKVTPLHSHPTETEAFYVLEGEVLLHVDGSDRAVESGGFASIPPGVPHAYLVTSETARTLIVITPGSGSMESFFRDAGEPAKEPSLPPASPLDIERIGAAAARSGAVTILGPPPFQSPSA
jgi:mannose-6-phosphate isomerase-like protein (cupin superfamily)